MKKIILALLLLTTCQLPALAANGSSVRGGGKVVACRDARGNLLSVELLDLWEATKFYKRSITESRQPVEVQVKNSILRLRNINNFQPSMTNNPNLRPEEKVAAGVMMTAQPFLEPNAPTIRRLTGVGLSPTDDSYEAIYPQQPGCQIEQIVVYQDRSSQDPEILLNQDLYEKMSPTNQAALIVHEALYAYLRIFEDKDSIRTRRVVGYVFAGLTFPSLNKTLPKKYIACYIERPEKTYRVPFFFAYKGNKPNSFEVIRNYDLRPLPSLGYFPTTMDVETVQPVDDDTQKYIMENLFSDRLCDAPYMKEPGHVMAGLLTMTGTGPADYDQGITFNFACLADGTRQRYIWQGDVSTPDGLGKKRDLYCEEKENSGI